MRLFVQFTSVVFLAAAALLTAAVHADEPAPLATPIRFARIPPEPVPLPPVEGESGDRFMTLAEAETMAITFHPAMREAEGLVRAARGQWLQVGLRPNPAIGYDGTDIGDDDSAGKQGGLITQEFVTAGKLGLNRAVALRQVSAAEQRLEQTRQQVITTVRMYYYESLAAERAVALAGQLEQVGAQALRASELRLQALEGTRAALLQSQVEMESARLLLEQSTYRRDAAVRRLASITGTNETAPPALEDTLGAPLPTFDWAAARERLLTESPELAELQANVERARWAVDQATAGRVPNVNMMAGMQFDNATNDTIANAQLSVPIPIFNRNQGNIASACGQLTAARAALENRELQLMQRLAVAIRDYNTASRRVAKYSESILPAARQSLDLISQAYEQGELEYLEILNTQRTYTEKNIDYLANLESAWKQWAVIDGLLVGPLPESN